MDKIAFSILLLTQTWINAFALESLKDGPYVEVNEESLTWSSYSIPTYPTTTDRWASCRFTVFLNAEGIPENIQFNGVDPSHRQPDGCPEIYRSSTLEAVMQWRAEPNRKKTPRKFSMIISAINTIKPQPIGDRTQYLEAGTIAWRRNKLPNFENIDFKAHDCVIEMWLDTEGIPQKVDLKDCEESIQTGLKNSLMQWRAMTSEPKTPRILKFILHFITPD